MQFWVLRNSILKCTISRRGFFFPFLVVQFCAIYPATTSPSNQRLLQKQLALNQTFTKNYQSKSSISAITQLSIHATPSRDSIRCSGIKVFENKVMPFPYRGSGQSGTILLPPLIPDYWYCFDFNLFSCRSGFDRIFRIFGYCHLDFCDRLTIQIGYLGEDFFC